MPELPEMYAYSRKFVTEFGGSKLETCSFMPSKRLNAPPGKIAKALTGEKLTDVVRIGKELFFQFGEHELYVHLMIAGKYQIEQLGDEPIDDARASFEFADGKTLHVRDRTGWVKFALDPERPTEPDALSPAVDADFFKAAFKKSPRAEVKAFLIDQDKLRGIGNAYSDEILWASRINPHSRCGKLPDEAVETLAAKLHEVLDKAIAFVDSLDDPLDYRANREMAVHVPGRETSPGGAEITVEKWGSRKIYYTDEQVEYL